MDFNQQKKLGIDPESIKKSPIALGPYGKPDFSHIPGIYFSVSHTGPYWGCVFDTSPVGFDMEDLDRIEPSGIQSGSKERWENIAKRFFTSEEYDFVKEKGAKAFFQLWVRKEAFLKYKGTGIRGSLSAFNLIMGNRILEHIDGVNLYGMEICPGLIGAICSKEQINIERVIRYDNVLKPIQRGMV